ncbi:YetF domain-containing protein [Ornithinibacillus bavariensis]|uniref:YetF domain-containing protein n=1 Tax=Ornithinibacillus bavariensis TaxID=545502 RepID=UPI000ED9D845|nr:DUF421 domain-containing protein [Ornithinibacillus sp.]
MLSYWQMFIESVFGFFILYFLTKVLGKTQISQLTPFDFISAIILGELVGSALFEEKAGVLHIGFVILIWGGLIYFVEMITQKFKRTRFLLEGSPEIIIRKGKLIRNVMAKNKLDINQLQHLLREKDVFSLKEVEYAILETNGAISVLKKSDYQTPNRKDMKLAPQPVQLSTTLINDGEIIYDNLEEKNLTEQWLIEQLKEQGYDDVNDVFYAEYMKDEDLLVLPFVNRKNRNK